MRTSLRKGPFCLTLKYNMTKRESPGLTKILITECTSTRHLSMPQNFSFACALSKHRASASTTAYAAPKYMRLACICRKLI